MRSPAPILPFVATLFLLYSALIAFTAAELAPKQLHLAYTGPASQMSLMFVADAAGTTNQGRNYLVEYKIAGRTGSRVVKAQYKPYSLQLPELGGATYGVRQYEALLTGLQPNTPVTYRIGLDKSSTSSGDIEWYEEKSFVAKQEPPKVGASSSATKPQYPYSFIVYGDMDTGYAGQETAKNVFNQIERDPSIRFVVHAGDLPYAWPGAERKWDDFFDHIEPISSRVPYMVCTGNHEDQFNFTSFKSRFTNLTALNSASPGGNLFYSWDYANIHFVALSSEHPYLPNSQQYQWLEADLKAVDRRRTPFVITYTHRPMYSSNKNHGSEQRLRDALEPLFRRYGVDLALFGHVHAYERTCQVNAAVCADQRGYFGRKDLYVDPTSPVHVHVGTAGFELNREWDNPQPEWSRYRETNHGFLKLIMYNEETLKIQFLRNNNVYMDSDRENEVGDVFSIVKTRLAEDGFRQLSA